MLLYNNSHITKIALLNVKESYVIQIETPTSRVIIASLFTS